MRASGRSVATATTILALITSLAPLAALAIPSASRPASPRASDTAIPTDTCVLVAGTRTCELWARTGTVDLPGAAGTPIWGFSAAPVGAVGIPGPTIVAIEGETLVVNLHNDLATATSLSFPGHDGAAPDPVGAGPGGEATYTLDGLRPGTFVYQAGLTADGAAKVAMGLAGALIVRPAGDPGSAYGSPASAFDTEALLFASEIDPLLNAAPATFDMARFHPTYWLFGGLAYPATEPIPAEAGDRVLLRIVNGGLLNQSMGLVGAHQAIVASAGRALDWPYDVVAETVPAGTTLDTIVTIPAATADGTLIPVMSSADHLDNAGQTSGGLIAFGGMLTFIDVSSAPAPVDTTGPTVSSVAVDPEPTNSSTGVTVSAIASDAATGGSDVDAAEYFVDDLGCVGGSGTAMTFGGPSGVIRAASATLGTALAEGTHTVTLHAHDTATNWGPCSSVTLTVDQTGPVTSGASAGPNPTLGADTVTIAAGAADPTVGGAASSIVAGEYFVGVVDPGTGNGTAMTAADGAFDTPSETLRATIATATLGVGSHTFSIRARDAAGNWGSVVTTTVVVDATIFADGFESGTLSAWDGVVGSVGTATSAAMDGTVWGMTATVAGSGAYVTDDTPTAETSYHARFWFDPNGIVAGPHTILDARTSDGRTAASVEIQRTKNGKHQVRASIARAKGSAVTTPWFTLPSGGHAIEIAWAAGTSGSLRLYVDGTLRQSLLGVNTGTHRIDAVRLGPSRGLGGVSGTERFDEFISNRTAYIGP